jgi:hypothetical protein
MKTRTKLLLSVAVVGAIGVMLAIGTSAFFSSSVTSSTNVAATGTMSMSGGNTVYFDSSAGDGHMRPVALGADNGLTNARTSSSRVQGTATVTNSGTFGIDLALSQTRVGGTGFGGGTGLVTGGDPALFKLAQLCVTQTAPVAGPDCGVYNGNFDMSPASPDDTGDNVESSSATAGTVLPGASATYRFEVWLPNSAETDNDYQAQIATAEFRFNGS